MINKSSKIYIWLQKQFYYSNHSKYRKYFDEWISNITNAQISGFEDQMLRLERLGVEHL